MGEKNKNNNKNSTSLPKNENRTKLNKRNSDYLSTETWPWMLFSSKASAVTCGSSAAAWSLYGSVATPYSSPGEGGRTASVAGTTPRNTIQSQSQETLFFRDTLFPSLLPSVAGNHNLLWPCIRRINFLLGTESVVLSRRREMDSSHALYWVQPPTYPQSWPKEVRGCTNTS